MRKSLIFGAATLALCSAPLAVSQATWTKPQTISADSAMSVDPNRGVLTMAPLIEQVSPAVVSIRTEAPEVPDDEELTPEQEMMERFFGRQMPRRRQGGSVGSGVIVDAANGYIMTNNHVVEDKGEILVTLTDRRELKATLVGGDDKTDIAILKVDASNLREITLGQDDAAKVGDYVVAIGNPFGLGHTVTTGIVSALGREFQRGDQYQDFIQTDASINPGNSGGALVNSRGELIGVNSAIISRSGGNDGIGFAVPTKIARNVMAQIIDNGEVRRGRIGVSIRNITPDFKQAFELSTLEGAFINDVTADSPSDKAGIKSGDIVTEFNGDIIRDASDLRNAVGLVQPGSKVDMTYLRDGKRRTTRIEVEEIKASEREVLDASTEDAVPAMESFSGASITSIPDGLNPRGGDAGVYVSRVESGSRAARAGLARGDIIRKVGRTTIDDLKAFEDAISEKDGPLALTVERDGQTLFIAVR